MLHRQSDEDIASGSTSLRAMDVTGDVLALEESDFKKHEMIQTNGEKAAKGMEKVLQAIPADASAAMEAKASPGQLKFIKIFIFLSSGLGFTTSKKKTGKGKV